MTPTEYIASLPRNPNNGVLLTYCSVAKAIDEGRFHKLPRCGRCGGRPLACVKTYESGNHYLFIKCSHCDSPKRGYGYGLRGWVVGQALAMIARRKREEKRAAESSK